MQLNRIFIIHSYRSIYIDEFAQWSERTLHFWDLVFRCRRGRHDEPFGGLVVYLAGDCLQSQSDIQKKHKYHSDYSKIIFENPEYMKIFSLVYFPEEFNKRHVDKTFRKLVSDLRVGNLKDEHIKYLQTLGRSIPNVDKIKKAMLIVNGDVSAVLQKGNYIFAANEYDRQVVSSRQTKCKDAFEEVGNAQRLWPLDTAGNVQIIFSEIKQWQKYESYYQNSLRNINPSHVTIFKATINILAYKGEDFLGKVDLGNFGLKGTNLMKQSWYLEVSSSLPNDEIVIVQGNTYSIVINSKEGYRHEPVKVIEVDENKVI